MLNIEKHLNMTYVETRVEHCALEARPSAVRWCRTGSAALERPLLALSSQQPCAWGKRDWALLSLGPSAPLPSPGRAAVPRFRGRNGAFLKDCSLDRVGVGVFKWSCVCLLSYGKLSGNLQSPF